MTSALHTASLVHSLVPRSPHTRVHSLPKEAPAFAILFDTSLSMLQVKAPSINSTLSLRICEIGYEQKENCQLNL